MRCLMERSRAIQCRVLTATSLSYVFVTFDTLAVNVALERFSVTFGAPMRLRSLHGKNWIFDYGHTAQGFSPSKFGPSYTPDCENPINLAGGTFSISAILQMFTNAILR